MGLSSSKTTSGPSKQALPYLQSASGAVQGVYDANKGNLSELGGGLMDAYRKFSTNAGSDLAGTRGYANDVLGGKYLTQQNPYLKDMIDQTNNSVMDRVNALFSQAGQTGSTAQVGSLGRELANSENALRYQNYSDEMARMGNAAQLGLGLDQATNADAATQAALAQAAAELPYTGADKLAAALGGLWGNSTTTKSSPGLGSVLGQAIGAGVGAFAASDRRLKTNIRKIGEYADGLGRYVWTYIWGGPEQEGVMAEEVAEKRPWAVGPKLLCGYSSVNYGAL
jgi:hypothetical protein